VSPREDTLEGRRAYEACPAAVRRIRGTGAVTYAGWTLAGPVDDAPGARAAMSRAQVRPGVIPPHLLESASGPGHQFRVLLARARQVFAGAYAGLARSARGLRCARSTAS
jgi:hypothetical protein